MILQLVLTETICLTTGFPLGTFSSLASCPF